MQGWILRCTFRLSCSPSLRTALVRLSQRRAVTVVRFSIYPRDLVLLRGWLVAREGLFHRLLQALDGFRKLVSMPFSASAPGAVPFEHGLVVVGDLLGEYAECRTC